MTNSLTTIDGKFYKECQVIMLPSKETIVAPMGPNYINHLSLYVSKHTRDLTYNRYLDGQHIPNPQHLYILSDEEIEENDWYCSPGGIISQHNGSETLPYNWKKIIATTEPLKEHDDRVPFPKMKHSLPRPSNEFLEAYVKAQGKINKVLVEYIGYDYELFLGQKEIPKGYKIKVAPDNTISIKKLQNEFSKESVLNWLETRFTKEAPLEYIINEYKKEFLNGSNT